MKINKKKGIISIIVLSIVILILGLVVLFLFISNYRKKRTITEEEKIFFNEQISICSEIYDNTYTSEKNTAYELVVKDLNSHMKAYEQLITSSSFKHKRKEISGDYDYSMTLTYYSIDNMQYIYTSEYKYEDGVMEGRIKAAYIDDYVSFKSIYNEKAFSYETTASYNNTNYTVSCIESNYSIRAVGSDNKSYSFNVDLAENFISTSLTKKYSLTILSNKIKLDINAYDLVDTYVTVSTTVIDSKNMYEYVFNDDISSTITAKR